ncbi:hypothetical protein CFC21_088075 [Triticum aestivum]|uniref:Uncharacterized protein n=2 Tax=Triticum aestivum TaxID=4565 RepID=A0A3B6PKV1_WHEAT|nr:uncharacterized protein LOC123137067 isoform X1 [Triticum aestivum]XP_044412563.1 uncharacterized protein LOC123137067 isoform X1 [Triticum aestivum]KAF7084453.1 hypothetical protein CFC21_088075 [Triticum aestivum]
MCKCPQDEFDDIDKLTLLSLEFTWSAEDDPIRPVILAEMKKIKSGNELVEEVKKIEKNINAGSSISSQLELSISGMSLGTCEVPMPSHSAEQDRESPKEERPQIEEEILEDKEQDDPELEQPSDQVEDSSSTTPKEVKEALVIELEEPEIHLPIVIQERDVAGLSNPLDDMRPYDSLSSTLHYLIPSLKVDLRKYFLVYDDIYPVYGIAHICYDDTYFPHARPMLNKTFHFHASLELNDSYHPHASIELTYFYHPKHVLYSYAYVIGYSIDDLEGITPVTVLSLLLSAFSGCCFCIVHFMLTRFKATFLGTLADPEHGDEEKQWAHTRGREKVEKA